MQRESALNAIRLFVGPVPAAILAYSLLIAWYYSIWRKRHALMREALAARREALGAVPAKTYAVPTAE